MRRFAAFFCTLSLTASFAFNAIAGPKYITVASTTSTANSGLFDFLLEKFTSDSAIEVRVIAVGTGQAIRLARKGDVDVLFVHHRPSEEKFVADGYGEKRFDVMYNDFVIVGPKSDPARIKNCKSTTDALTKINTSGATFASRGDDSGTHKRETSLWKNAGISLDGTWYRATGSGMGATLNVAAGLNAYALSDRGTWISFKNKGDLQVLCEGHENLFNPYGVIAVSKKKFQHVKEEDAKTFIDWLTSQRGQQLIGDFEIEGQQLFTPNAK